MVDIFSFFPLDINNEFISAKFKQMKHVIPWITKVIIKKMEVACIYTSTIITLNNPKKYTLIIPLKEMQ
jgi:hypothetical protein